MILHRLFFLLSFLSMPCVVHAYTVKWYKENDYLVAQNTCSYGSLLSLPSQNPSKTGYDFGGWSVRSVEPVLQCSDANQIPAGYWRANNGIVTVTFGNINATFEIESKCSGTSGSNGSTGDPTGSSGTHCWCRVKNMQLSSGMYGSVDCSDGGQWVHDYKYLMSSLCSSRCANSCIEDINSNENNMNSALFRF